jgi:hypothetical protein
MLTSNESCPLPLHKPTPSANLDYCVGIVHEGRNAPHKINRPCFWRIETAAESTMKRRSRLRACAHSQSAGLDAGDINLSIRPGIDRAALSPKREALYTRREHAICLGVVTLKCWSRSSSVN